MALVVIANGLLGGPAHAVEYRQTASISKIYSLDRATQGAKDHITVVGLTAAGSCPLNDGLVVLALPDDEGGRRQMAMALMARAMGMTVHVRVDDAVKTQAGHCRLLNLELMP